MWFPASVAILRSQRVGREQKGHEKAALAGNQAGHVETTISFAATELLTLTLVRRVAETIEVDETGWEM